MCGIVGYWSSEPREVEDLATFTDMLAHRGPDGFGHMTADHGRLGLGHRRLAIVDPEPRALQPMATTDSRYTIVFNGEIYNFIEIRSELASKGYRFHTDSDTEVILNAYAEWGPACQGKFNGMWAFVIWDNHARSLFFSRDRFGVKPLWYLETAEGLAFASEAKAFFALPWLDAGVLHDNGDGVEGRGPRMLPAGSYGTLHGPREPLSISRWWHPIDFVHGDDARYPEQVEAFRELFFDACRLRLRSDVPVATAISGGVDSSSVLAAVHALGANSVARRPADWSRAFTAVAPGTDHDELAYAEAACSAVDIEPIVLDVFQRADADEIDEYLYLTEGLPLTNLPAWYLYRAMRRNGVRVSLDGQGADEILAGYYYDAFRFIQLEASWLRRPARTLDLLITTHGVTQGSPYFQHNSKAQVLAILLLLSSPSLRRAFKGLLGHRFTLPSVDSAIHDWSLWESAKTLPPLNAIMFWRINEGIQPLLERYDLLSMSSGIEMRMPFLDWRLVTLTLSLPPESILGHGFTKRVLRDAMRPYLPAKVLNRKKKLQFQGPIQFLLQRPLRRWVESVAEGGVGNSDLLPKGNYRQISDYGVELVERWKRHSYLRLARSKAASLRAQHRAKPPTEQRCVQAV